MDADAQLARRLQEEEDRASAAAVAAALSRDAEVSGARQRRFRDRLEGGVRTALAHEDREGLMAWLAGQQTAPSSGEREPQGQKQQQHKGRKQKKSARSQ